MTIYEDTTDDIIARVETSLHELKMAKGDLNSFYDKLKELQEYAFAAEVRPEVYRVENGAPDNNWLVVTTGSDGIVDIVAEVLTEADAISTCELMNREYHQSRFDEMRYQAQYAHACGYYD